MTVHPAPGTPDVSVVIIAFNDAKRLPQAVRSVLDQTLSNLEVIIVDDASTDGTGEVADGFTRLDPRVRAVHLPENSGGCSRPRNVGMDHARAPYVMFLDSDDTYTRHACKNLLVAAERTGADVVGGPCVRIEVGSGKERLWASQVYSSGQRVVLAGIRDMPELFLDAISTNKIYRRDFLDEHGIRFPEGLHYEDQLFTAQVYCLARTIALIPTLVYRWMVVRGGEQHSISQRRFEFENFRDRIRVHRLIDAFLIGHGAPDLKVDKDVKFVRHDLRLYLNDLAHRDADYQRRFMELARDYLSTVSDQTLERVDQVHRICVAMIRQGDVEETLRTVDWLKHGFKLSTALVERDGRIYWTDRYLDDPGMREVLDVTALRLHELPFSRQSVYNEVTAFDVALGKLSVTGHFLNQFLQISPEDRLRLVIEVKSRAGKDRKRFVVRDVRYEGDRVSWSAQIDLARAIGRLDRQNPVWDIMLEISWDGHVNRSAFSTAPDLVAGRWFQVRGRFHRLLPGRVEPYVTTNGNLAFEQVPDRLPAMRVLGKAHGFSARTVGSLRRRLFGAAHNTAMKRRAFRLFKRLPPVPGLAVFQSQLGQHYTGNPKYVYEAARDAGVLEDVVWVHAGSTAGFPQGVRLVQRGSWALHWYLARAQFWVDDQGFPRQFSKPAGTTYVQTWHGTALKRMGFDSPALEAAGARERAAHQAMIDRWDCLLAPSEYFVDTFARSYRYRGRVLRSGSPRNDPLVRPSIDVEDLREKLEIPAGRTVVLYAPTFRDRDLRLNKPFELQLDLDALLAQLGEDHYFLVRPHYLDKLSLPRRHQRFVGDVSKYPDVTELLLVADVLVTDYSSVMFDYANLGRPMVFYTYDYEDYIRDERGTYLDLEEVAPGPLVSDTEGLIAALRNVEQDEPIYRERYAAFRERFCAYETGRAAETVVAELLSGRPA